MQTIDAVKLMASIKDAMEKFCDERGIYGEDARITIHIAMTKAASVTIDTFTDAMKNNRTLSLRG